MAAGIELEQPNQSDVWYPTVPTIWAVTGSVIKKYGNQGFRFEEDKIFYQNYITRK
jgi:hypothetical protein